MSEPLLATSLRERAGPALQDDFLKQALTIATTKFIAMRREAFAGFPDGEALRDRAREIKEATLQRLDHYLEQLVGNIEARGGHVHYATGSAEACAVILDIARRVGARTVVKSKSMATEEIGLNEALLQAGIMPVETDLGEYIIQLARERPSHIIAPAIHKTKEQVAELFTRALHRPVAADPEALTRVARGELREKFLEADMGVTGANFAVADTGTVVLVTNEGNGRMVTSLPRVHVAVMGVEKHRALAGTDRLQGRGGAPRAPHPRSPGGARGPAAPAPLRARSHDSASAPALRPLDGDARPARARAADLHRAVARARGRRAGGVTDRAEFLERIRVQIRGASGLFRASVSARPARPVEAADIIRRQLAERWPVTLERFQAEFERVGGVFHRVAEAPEVPGVVARIAREGEVHRVITWPPPTLPAGWAEALAASGLCVDTMPPGALADEATRPGLRRLIADAEIGLTGVDLAVAETGSLVLVSGHGRPRTTSLLPPCHVAVFGPACLVESLGQLGVFLEAWHAEGGPRWRGGAINVITGPSRTADIELTLTRGVHGPKELHAIFVDGDLPRDHSTDD